VRASNLAAIRLGENLIKPGGPDTPSLLVPLLLRASLVAPVLVIQVLKFRFAFAYPPLT
jgi:hypothetical protein